MSPHAHAHSGDGHQPVETEQFWEQHYRRSEQVWSERANPVLVDVVQCLPPGTTLDLGRRGLTRLCACAGRR